MSARLTPVINLDTLKEGLPGLTAVIGAYFAEASLVCFHHHGHRRGVRLALAGTAVGSCEVIWSDVVTEQVVQSWQDMQELAEFGACGVAILLVLALTEFTVVRRAVKGDGIDYWLGRSRPPGDEVSGLRTAPDQSGWRASQTTSGLRANRYAHTCATLTEPCAWKSRAFSAGTRLRYNLV
jgi:hypothetical protein